MAQCVVRVVVDGTARRAATSEAKVAHCDCARENDCVNNCESATVGATVDTQRNQNECERAHAPKDSESEKAAWTTAFPGCQADLLEPLPRERCRCNLLHCC